MKWAKAIIIKITLKSIFNLLKHKSWEIERQPYNKLVLKAVSVGLWFFELRPRPKPAHIKPQTGSTR